VPLISRLNLPWRIRLIVLWLIGHSTLKLNKTKKKKKKSYPLNTFRVASSRLVALSCPGSSTHIARTDVMFFPAKKSLSISLKSQSIGSFVSSLLVHFVKVGKRVVDSQR
jgi:hypothetical protein